MPFYDYKCTACGEKFEIMKGMNDQADPKCPVCGAQSSRVFYATRTLKPAGETFTSHSHEHSGACGSCSSGVCSSCSSK